MSNTGTFETPISKPALPGELTLKQFLHTVFAGISGISNDLVRPKWQPNPPKQPDLLVNWLAIALTANRADDNAFVGASPGQKATGFLKFICNPEPLDIVTINGTVVTFVASAPSGDQVLIGTKPSDTAKNLQVFLSASSHIGLMTATYVSFAEAVSITFKTIGTTGNAFTLVSSTSVILLSGATLLGGGASDNYTQRHEDLEIQCSFYGPDADELASMVRDGFQIEQNRESLKLANMGFVSTSEMMHVPDLVNERWIDRYEMSVFLRREIQRAYPVLAFAKVQGTIQTDTSNLKTVAIDVNV